MRCPLCGGVEQILVRGCRRHRPTQSTVTIDKASRRYRIDRTLSVEASWQKLEPDTTDFAVVATVLADVCEAYGWGA